VTATELPRNEPTAQSAWTVVGTRHKGIVTHLAVLARNVRHLRYGNRVPVYHMGPPLTSLEPEVVGNEDVPEGAAEDNPASSEITAHVAARLEDLGDADREGMRRWHRKISVFFPAATRPPRPRPRPGAEREWAHYFEQTRYIAHPAFKVEEDPVSGIKKFHRYSCVGFVTECYQSTAVDQVLTDSSRASFPRIDQAMVERLFVPPTLRLTEEIAESINLTGNGPWPVALPGYVMRAFTRTDEEIRNHAYHPSVEDIDFLGAE